MQFISRKKDIIWVDNTWYSRAVQRLISQNKRQVSLVDCMSFEIMDTFQIKTAFAFDKHFEQNGFTLL